MLDLEAPSESSPQPADFESFYLAHRNRLFRALVVVTRDVHAAEELTQEAFSRVWERWEQVERMDDPVGYLHRTALNGWFQVHRRAMRAARRLGGLQPVVDPIERVEQRDLLARRLLELSARQRAALVLTEYLGYDSAAAGRAMGVRPGTVRRLASLARASVRSGDEEEGTR